MRVSLHKSGCFVFWAAVTATSAQGQWLTQNFLLQQGWNSVFIEVDPSPAHADELFAGLPITAVWTRAPAQFVEGPPDCQDPDDPTCVPPDTGDWWVWLPPNDPHALVRNLRLIRGGRVYLIHATQATNLSVTGEPSSTVTAWRSGFNLSGLYVVDDVNSASTFTGYFSGSPVHANTTVFRIQSNGSPVPVTNLGTTRITPGKGYWVKCSADIEYDGPIGFDPASLRGIDFAENLLEHYMRLTNLTSGARNVTLAYTPSASVPSSPAGLPALAGDVPLAYLSYQSGQVEDAFTWQELVSQAFALGSAGQPAAARTIRLGVRRAGLAPAMIDGDGPDAAYQGLLRVTDGEGYERYLPVSTQVLPGIGGVVAGGNAPRPGLYFGHVTVNEVTWITAGAPMWMNDDPTDPVLVPNPDGDTVSLRPAPAEFSFPVLIHVSENGAYKMLTEVTLLWEPGDAEQEIPGRYVLATPACDPAVCDALVAGSIQDGQPFARRISTAAFSFDGDLLLSGDFASTLTGQTVLPPNHRLNPFRHGYHPDHDCSADGECFEVTRTFTFQFASEPPAGLDNPQWGDTVVGGTYVELLAGLHKDPVGVRGRFDLRRVVNVPVLNAD